MSDLSAYGSSIQALKEQAQSCRVKPQPTLCTHHHSHCHLLHSAIFGEFEEETLTSSGHIATSFT